MLSDKEMHARMAKGWIGGRFDGTVCGAGSALKFTGNVREILPIWCERYRIASVADAGAGDLHWISHVQWPVDYRAYDLIPRHPAVVKWDITRDALPAADAILCRGVLNHLDPDRVQMAVDLFRQSGTYLMATQIDRGTGQGSFSWLDLREYVGEPVEAISEGHDSYTKFALWRL